MIQWSKQQIKLLSNKFNKKTNDHLQEVGAFLDEEKYHYLVSSLNLTRSGEYYYDYHGNSLYRTNIKIGYDNNMNKMLSMISVDSAIKDSEVVCIVYLKDIEVSELILTYNSDTLIRAYLDGRSIPPLLVGYNLLLSFISNVDINGYSLVEAKDNHLGLEFICGIMGQTKHKDRLKEILHETNKSIF